MIPHDVDISQLIDRLSSEALHVMLAMLDRCESLGNRLVCRTNRVALRARTRMGERALSSHIATLQACGFIEREGSNGREVAFTIRVPMLPGGLIENRPFSDQIGKVREYLLCKIQVSLCRGESIRASTRTQSP